MHRMGIYKKEVNSMNFKKTYKIGEKIVLTEDLTLCYPSTNVTKTYKKGSVLYATGHCIKLPDNKSYYRNDYKADGYDIDGMIEYIEKHVDIKSYFCDEDDIEDIKESLAEYLEELLI